MTDPFADEPRRPAQTSVHVLGQDLASLSMHELEERIAQLQDEITRLQQAMSRKTASLAAAESVFRL